jgi:hypothetical protein
MLFVLFLSAVLRQRGDIKIFDFGLAKELHDEDKDTNGLFKLTGMTGSPRYMAPGMYLPVFLKARSGNGRFAHRLSHAFFLKQQHHHTFKRSAWRFRIMKNVTPTRLQFCFGKCFQQKFPLNYIRCDPSEKRFGVPMANARLSRNLGRFQSKRCYDDRGVEMPVSVPLWNKCITF